VTDRAGMVLLAAGSNQDAVWEDPDDPRTYSWVSLHLSVVWCGVM
jgi:hypothetical protein